MENQTMTTSNQQHERTVFELNSNAARLLQQGNYSGAIAKLQAAMGWMRALVYDPARPGFELVPTLLHGSQAEKDSIDDLSILSVPAHPHEEMMGSLSHMDTLFKHFDHAFVTPYMDYQGSRGLRMTTSFVLYNLALCYTTHEIATGTMRPEKLHAALRFYVKALRIIDGAFEDGRPDDMTVLILAIFNNMGFLFAHYGEVNEVKHCIHWIRKLLATDEAQRLRHTRWDIQFFFENCLFVDNIFDNAAAA